jgi:hypothetical protein
VLIESACINCIKSDDRVSVTFPNERENGNEEEAEDKTDEQCASRV